MKQITGEEEIGWGMNASKDKEYMVVKIISSGGSRGEARGACWGGGGGGGGGPPPPPPNSLFFRLN